MENNEARIHHTQIDKNEKFLLTPCHAGEYGILPCANTANHANKAL